MRIDGVPADKAPPEVLHIYQKSAGRLGRVPAPLTAMAHCPDFMQTLTALSGALTGSQRVEPRLKTLACLRAAQIAGCPF